MQIPQAVGKMEKLQSQAPAKRFLWKISSPRPPTAAGGAGLCRNPPARGSAASQANPMIALSKPFDL